MGFFSVSHNEIKVLFFKASKGEKSRNEGNRNYNFSSSFFLAHFCVDKSKFFNVMTLKGFLIDTTLSHFVNL